MKSISDIISEVGSSFADISYAGALQHAPDDLTTKQSVELMQAAILSSALHSIAESINAVASALDRLVDEGITIDTQDD